MRIPGRRTLVKGFRRLRSRLGDRGLILGYHSVSDDEWDPFSLRVSVSNFTEHLQVLRELTVPVSLATVCRAAEEKTIPPGTVALTFDDGYADGLHVAKPLLKEHEIPATFFLISGYMGGDFWWEALARLLHPARALPQSLSIEAAPGAPPLWLSPGSTSKSRRMALLALQSLLRDLGLDARHETLARLGRALEVGADEDVRHRPLRTDEARALSVPAFFEIGSHGHTHRRLTVLPAEECLLELEESRALLEEATGASISAFSFPHGSVPVESDRILRQSGYRRGCSSTEDVVRPAPDLFDLPRLWPPNVGGRRFSQWIRQWL